MHTVLDHMNTKISIDIPDYYNQDIIAELNDLFSDIEQRYSVFIANSEVSRYANGMIALNNTSPGLRHIIALSKSYQSKTDGYFTPYFNNKFNPTGLVKGWAIKQAENLLKVKNIDTFMINAGGDIICQSINKQWNIAIVNPKNNNDIIANINCKDLAVATSGSYERGQHIVNPKNNKSIKDLLSVSVISKNIIDADVFATALFAMGKKAINFAKKNNIKAIVIDKNGLVNHT